MVPLLDVNAQNLPLESEFQEAFLRVFRSGRFILGPEVEKFEEQIAKLTATRHCIGVSSGTDALLLALMALDIGKGDEVLCPTFTFFATAGAIQRSGATPVFVDSCPVCFNIDVSDAANKITSRTKAIIPVHLFGQSADMDAVNELAATHHLKVIEDAAQAIGARYRDQCCGSMGDIGTFSFFPSKNLGGFGDAGAVVCHDDSLAEKARVLRTHGAKPKYHHHLVGGNFRIDPLQTAMLGVKLPHYQQYTAARQANAAYYVEKLSAVTGIVQADPAHCKCAASQSDWINVHTAKLVLPVAYQHNFHIWNQFTLRVIGDGRRDALKQFLHEHDIGCEIYYPITMDQQKCFAALPALSRSGCAVAHQLANECLSIPVYPELTRQQQDEVVMAIKTFLAD